MYVSLAICVAFAYGIKEGISMHQPSNRVHWWYWFYHRTGLLAGAFLFLLAYDWGYANGSLSTDSIALWMLPAVILGNRFYEIAYGMTRYKNPFPDYENFLGFGANTGDFFNFVGWRLRLLQYGGLAFGFVFWYLTQTAGR